MILRCLCRGVEAQITPPTIAVTHCHCDYCRRAHGAAFVTWLLVPEAQFRLTRGAQLLRWRPSSTHARRAFCTECGSPMLYTSPLQPGEIHVARALVEGPVDQQPSAHCFTDQKVPWVHLDDGLPELDSDSELLAHFKKIDPL